jgi:hypothetical protein
LTTFSQTRRDHQFQQEPKGTAQRKTTTPGHKRPKRKTQEKPKPHKNSVANTQAAAQEMPKTSATIGTKQEPNQKKKKKT